MATKKEEKTDAPEVSKPVVCGHERTYVAKVGTKGQLAQVCPDCGVRKEAGKNAVPGKRPMPLGHPERFAARVAELERKITRQKEVIAAAGPQSDEAKGLNSQMDRLAWKLGHAKRRSANAATRAAK